MFQDRHTVDCPIFIRSQYASLVLGYGQYSHKKEGFAEDGDDSDNETTEPEGQHLLTSQYNQESWGHTQKMAGGS